jgi:glucose/arabinose dehydrogenase
MHRRKLLKIGRALVIPFALGASLSLSVSAGPAPLAIGLEPVLANLSEPVYVTAARDGSGRLFVVEKRGVIKVLQPGGTKPSVFLDISNKVTTTGTEQGLLGLAFHPRFATNRRFYVNYTRSGDGKTVVAEYRASAGNPNKADKDTRRTLLTISQPAPNHNGGMLEFGPHDGYLYIFMGDGGPGNDPDNRGQDLESRLGKILRIDIDRPNGKKHWSVPPDNPFVGQLKREEIYALGFRNPWRASFDRLTSALYVGDVGQSAREEISIVAKGGNLGWRVFEGEQCSGLDADRCGDSGFIAPIVTYQTHAGGRCAVVGGYVYRGARGALPDGTYVFGDFCSGEIFSLAGGVFNVLLPESGVTITSFGEDEAGELYVVGREGTVHRIVGN